MRKQLLTYGLWLTVGFAIGWFVRGESEFASGSQVGFEQAMQYWENARDESCKRRR